MVAHESLRDGYTEFQDAGICGREVHAMIVHELVSLVAGVESPKSP